jgi:tRNA threonylcarbamoyladenosine biosynthesis protein TsaE
MDNTLSITTTDARETQKFAEELAATLKKEKGSARETSVICFFGDLGSGKTTFIQGFAKALGIHRRLLSPTFIIVRRYPIPESDSLLYHVDLYRTKTSYDIENLGFAEILEDPGSYVCIEWAEKLGSLLPKKRIDIHFVTNKDDSHTIIMKRV